MSESNRGQRSTQLQRLGAEYGNLTDRKLAQWLDMTDHATPEQMEKAVDKILRDPEREHLPRIGHLLALLPRRAEASESFAHWNWITLTCHADLGRLPSALREREAALGLRLYPESRRNCAEWFDAAKPLILAFDPKAMEKEAMRQKGSPPEVGL